MAFGALALLAGAFVAIGCSQSHPSERGYADTGKTQIQFFSPPGATVAVKGCATRSHQIADYGPDGNRLERTPEEYSVFNLSPGTYEFKYTAADGLDDVAIYGELDVRCLWHNYAKTFKRRSFVPIRLPSSYYRQVDAQGDEGFPYRGQRLRTAIDETDLMRLKQGDVIEKVFFVADLERATEVAAKAKIDLAVLDRKLEYAEAKFRDSYAEWRLVSEDPIAVFFGADRAFIRWEKKRLELQDKITETQARLKRAQALLDGDHVLVRRGMLALATEDVVAPHRDVVDAADDMGEVLLVMRIGGRHMHWGDPPAEAVAFNP